MNDAVTAGESFWAKASGIVRIADIAVSELLLCNYGILCIVGNPTTISADEGAGWNLGDSS